jgi:hypothetical protein
MCTDEKENGRGSDHGHELFGTLLHNMQRNKGL